MVLFQVLDKFFQVLQGMSFNSLDLINIWHFHSSTMRLFIASTVDPISNCGYFSSRVQFF